MNPDGTVTAATPEYEQRALSINQTLREIKNQIAPLIRFIRQDVFLNAPIKSQELIVHKDMGIMAICDLSTEAAVLEIKTNSNDLNKYAEQLHYEANGRQAFLLTAEWNTSSVEFTISKITTYPGEKPDKRKEKARRHLTEKVKGKGITLLKYESGTSPISLRCEICGCEFEDSAMHIRNGFTLCPKCHPRRQRAPYGSKKHERKEPQRTLAEVRKYNADHFARTVFSNSGGTISVNVELYKGQRAKIDATCLTCGYTWQERGDHLLKRTLCPRCNKSNKRKHSSSE